MNFRRHGPCMVLGPAMEGGPEGGPEGKILKFQTWRRGPDPPGPPIVGNPAPGHTHTHTHTYTHTHTLTHACAYTLKFATLPLFNFSFVN